MLVLSFFLHAACVLVFSVAYPHSTGRAARSAEVFFLRPGSPEAIQLAPLLEASDPALFSPGQVFGRHVWKLPATGYIPSFDLKTPSLEPLAPLALEPMLPPLSETEFVGIREPRPVKKEPGLSTALHLGDGLAGRAFTPPKNIAFTAPRQGLAPTRFLLAVSPEGQPLHIIPLPDDVSGSESLDKAALRYLAATRFAPDPTGREPVWGTATFLWGADVVRENQP
ncbi:hypothetical protein BH09VER1_BH09VER1_04030 [soil metagenome]